MDFPKNPSDGMIFESTPGVYYQYSAGVASWYRVSTPSIPLASPLNDGLMSSDDFIKLTGLIIPPPQIALTFEDCDVSYDKGFLDITGDDDGIVQVDVNAENFHENTTKIDFNLDTEKLSQYLVTLGQLRLTAPQGLQGDKGDSGQDGANALPTGPQGEDGVDGANAPWPGILAEETFDIAQQSRAVVDIDVKKVSPEENYIVVRRANIGNPDSCPDTILPQDVQSPWILAFDAEGSVSATQLVSPVTGEVCAWACRSDLFYFDIDIILQSIKTHWTNYLNSVKAEKEALADTWLTAMIELFNEQKSALCCALEACRSRTRNVQTRQYIEQQRIQAAQGNYQLIIGGDDEKEFPPLDADGNCTWNIAPTNLNLTHLSDQDCEVDWTILCPDVIGTNWASAHSFNAMSSAYTQDVIVTVDGSGDPAAVLSASGEYTDGTILDSPELKQWVWSNNDGWILVIWYCYSDSKYASRLYKSDGINAGYWDFGGEHNVTQCFMAGEVLKILDFEPGMAFSLNGSNALAGLRANIKVLSK